MGTFNVEIEIGDPDGERFVRVEALAGSRASYTTLPSALLADLGVKPHRTVTLVTRDGSRVERGFSQTWIRLNNVKGIAPVVFGDDDAVPRLGHVTLGSLGLEIDAANERIVKMTALWHEHPQPVIVGDEFREAASDEKVL